VDGPVRLAEQPGDRRPVVEVDHGRCGATGGNGRRLGVVADERGHLVAVLVQIRQYMRSDEPGCAGEYHVHSLAASDEGFRTLADAAPGHVAHVRSLVIDVLSPEQLRRLGLAADRIMSRIDTSGVN
jgi:hypothetical protein